MTISRRAFVPMIAAAATHSISAANVSSSDLPICAFSKHFQWAGIEELASVCASLGYTGIDLTLRRGGHIEPATVENDLPRAVETIRKAGLTVPMVTTDIVDVRSANAETILRTLKKL